MKTIGMIGGMSWESTQTYYQLTNTLVKQRLGGLHSARILLFSVDFHEIEQLQRSGEWQKAGELLAEAAHTLQLAGAQVIILCTNTMHKVADIIESRITIPLLNLIDVTARAIKQQGLHKVALLGTAFTMEQSFYRDRLAEHQLQVLIPEPTDCEVIHRIIYQELCLGTILETSRQQYRDIMQRLAAQGAEGIILGCTEIALLVNQQDATVPLFDTTRLHAQAAVEWALTDS